MDYVLNVTSKTNLAPEDDDVEMSTDAHTDTSFGEDSPSDMQESVQPPTEVDEVILRFDASIQRMNWGGQLMRCQLQLSFSRRWFPPPEGGTPPPVEIPAQPGDCIFTEEEGMGLPPEDWFISGDLSGPQEVYIHSQEESISLVLVEAEDGLLRYEMQNCTENSFPFEQVFDLEIPPSEFSNTDQGLPEAYIEEVVVFGPDVQIIAPFDEPSSAQHTGYAEDGLMFEWDFLGAFPDVVPYDEFRQVWLTNNRNQPWDQQERLNCLPDDNNSLWIEPSELLQFTLNDYLGQGEYSIGINIHTDYFGPSRVDPWGRHFRASVNITAGGMMELAH